MNSIDKKSYEILLDPLWDASHSGTRLDLLTAPQRNILLLENFENQVYSSYIGDVFYNGGGQTAYGILEALQAVESQINTKLMQDAIALFPQQPIPDREACMEIMDEPDAETIDKWQALTGIPYDFEKMTGSTNRDHFPDAYLSPGGVLVVNRKVRDVFSKFDIDYIAYSDVDIKLKSGEILSGDYKAANVLNQADAIDRKKSEIEWSERYEDEDDRSLRRVRRLVLDASPLKRDELFSVDKLYRLFMRGDLANALLSAGAKGFEFCAADEFQN